VFFGQGVVVLAFDFLTSTSSNLFVCDVVLLTMGIGCSSAICDVLPLVVK